MSLSVTPRNLAALTGASVEGLGATAQARSARLPPADTFLSPPTAPARSATSTAGSWRAPADSELGRAIADMLARVRQCPVRLKGQTAEEVFSRAILDNPRITNEQLLAMRQVPLERLADSPADRAKVLQKIPNARELPSHQFTVAMLSAATGIDPTALSEATPSLGMTGAIGTPLFYAPRSERMQRSTALHDFTDYLRGAGVQGVNKAVWGSEDRIISALKSALGRWRYD